MLVLGRSSTWSPHILEKNESRIRDHLIKDQGSVQNESNKLNKLIGMIDCSSTWLSQDLPYAQAKIRENKRNRHKYNRYNKHKYTKYWKSHTTLKKCQIFSYQLLGQLLKTDSYRAGLLVHMLYSHEISKLSRVSVYAYVSDFRCNFKQEAVFDDCRSEQQIFSCFNFISSNFYWRHILKVKADGMHLKNHLLRRRNFSRFSDGIWQETWFGKW